MLAIKKDKGPPRTRKRIHKLPGLYATCCWVAPLLVASRKSLFYYQTPHECAHPLHTQVQTQDPVQGRRLHAQLRMAAPPCAAR